MARPRVVKQNLDELCKTCSHPFRKHLFGGRSCADEPTHCPCKLFVPSGRLFDWSEGAERLHVDPQPGDIILFRRQREHLVIEEARL